MQDIDMGGDIVVINGTPYSKIKLTVDWFQMDNDTFFRVHGFNFNPHNYPGLYEAGRRIVFRNEPEALRTFREAVW